MNEDIEDDGGEIQTFLHQHHAGCVLSRLHDLREREELCDVTLVVDGSAIQAHRAVLAASSQYFNAMFTAKMSERNQATVRQIFGFNGQLLLWDSFCIHLVKASPSTFISDGVW